ncbi:zinc finger protein without children isoform X3 [Tachypleus tridentatus]|uniref:zinc finger protein without children isoform X3 n=1 Tax=Tachypleus tridentatus TaxID=6853 RepID=UPI003FD3D6BD
MNEDHPKNEVFSDLRPTSQSLDKPNNDIKSSDSSNNDIQGIEAKENTSGAECLVKKDFHQGIIGTSKNVLSGDSCQLQNSDYFANKSNNSEEYKDPHSSNSYDRTPASGDITDQDSRENTASYAWKILDAVHGEDQSGQNSVASADEDAVLADVDEISQDRISDPDCNSSRDIPDLTENTQSTNDASDTERAMPNLESNNSNHSLDGKMEDQLLGIANEDYRETTKDSVMEELSHSSVNLSDSGATKELSGNDDQVVEGGDGASSSAEESQNKVESVDVDSHEKSAQIDHMENTLVILETKSLSEQTKRNTSGDMDNTAAMCVTMIALNKDKEQKNIHTGDLQSSSTVAGKDEQSDKAKLSKEHTLENPRNTDICDTSSVEKTPECKTRGSDTADKVSGPEESTTNDTESKKLPEAKATTEEPGGSGCVFDSSEKGKTDLQSESTGKEKGVGINAIADRLVQQIQTEPSLEEEVSEKEEDKENQKKSEDSSEVKKTSGDSENSSGGDSKQNATEMKGYITDTMNELLGLFGYEKVDESTKETIGTVVSQESSGTATITPAVSSATPAAEVSKKDSGSRETSPRSCAECGVTKGLKYQVLFQGKTRFLCSDNCFQIFRNKQKLAPPPPGVGGSRSAMENCSLCKKEIKNGQGYLPPTGENKPLCSEECMKRYQQIHGPKQVCAQCQKDIQGGEKCLMWEAMEFCSENCLGKYQKLLGSHCTCCHLPVQQPSLGKYCVRFGSDIRQFCSGRCLEEFKKGLKVCTYCQKDLSNGQEGFLAPVGEKGQFKDFCSQMCMERYEMMNCPVTPKQSQKCSVCNKVAPSKVQVKYEEKLHPLCSDPCIAAFRYANKINTNICDTCHKFFDSKVAPRISLQFEGQRKRFCSSSCMNMFVLSNRKIVPCTWCKVKKYNFDMIERVDSNNHVQLFCSLNCLSLFRVSLNATSSRSVACDHCHKMLPAQYHLTMSDASIRNFCSYPCVIKFQNKFTSVPTLTTSTPSVRQNSSTISAKLTTTQSPTPVISSVMSLAPVRAQTTQAVVQKNMKSAQQTRASVRASQPPPLTTINNKTHTAATVDSVKTPPIKSTATVTVTTTPSTPQQPQVIREVIVKPAAPRPLKNKALLCKPLMQTKGVSCKPHPCHKDTQTDEEIFTPMIIPVPVPIYVPAPMRMYSEPTPVPFPFPVPIPVPIFVPTTKDSSDNIVQTIKEIQEKIPENPFEADLLMMAESLAADGEGNDRNEKKLDLETETKNPDTLPTLTSFGDEFMQSLLPASSDLTEPILDLEEALAPNLPLQEGNREQLVDEEGSTPTRQLRSRQKGSKRSGGGRNRGRSKRAKLEEPESDLASTVENSEASLADANFCLKFTFGVKAWKHWVVQKNYQLEKGSQSRKLKLFKTDLLQLSPDELNYSLCLFVKEVRKPNGEEYAPDSIYYLCLGIQQYLFENQRIDNIFTDPYYEKFTECLNEVLQKFEVTLATDVTYVSRVEEEVLWESRQLGAHSPHVLLNTLMYFNTKYFLLTTVDDHMQLSFSHIMKHWRKNSTTSRTAPTIKNALLRYYPPMKDGEKKRKFEQAVLEQTENLDNPLRCPVKLYEFYLSKCPECVKTRTDAFYLYPERSCVPDSPVWYSTQPVGKDAIQKVLQRIKMVREISELYQDI